MIEYQGVFLPDGETHLVEWMAKENRLPADYGTYQIRKLRAAIAHCRSFRTAIDVGAHVGLWSMQLCKRFKMVYAFEPVAVHRDCFHRNLERELASGYCRLFACALGEREGVVSIETAPSSSGDSRVDIHAKEPDIPLCLLDDFRLGEVDFIKLDCEGYELFALRGGADTLERWRPVVIVEQKPGRAQRFGLPERGAVSFLQALGYRQVLELSGDFVMVP